MSRKNNKFDGLNDLYLVIQFLTVREVHLEQISKHHKRGVPIFLHLMGISLVMVIVVVCGIYFYLSPMFESELLKSEKRHSQELVQSVHSLVNEYYQRFQNKEFDEREAQSRALKRISIMRYGSSGYFWVNDMDAKMLMHPIQTELNGKDLSTFKDAKGKLLVMEFVRVCKMNGSGYVDYWWPEPGVNNPVEKTSYVRIFAPWNWVIGSGLYKTAMQRSLDQLRKEMLIGILGLIVLLVTINMIIAVRIARPLNRLSEFSVKLKDDLSLRAPLEGSLETRQLAMALNNTAEQLAVTLVSRDRLDAALNSLTDMQMQILQSEKMASIGQLAAGVAHEINNPMGFINSNLATLKKYNGRTAEFIDYLSEKILYKASAETTRQVGETRRLLKIDRILEDLPNLIKESIEGAERVKSIVQDLKSFSRVDQAECALVNLNEALDTTINIAWNEIKYVATLNREFGDLPQIKCYPQQLNQVFLNLLVNAAHAIGENQGIITVRTWSEQEDVLVSVADSGCGIPDDIKQRIFEPFFTTKEVGKGTGLGLSISYDIIRKHGGDITVESEVGRGTTFIVRLPINPAVGA
ncbi:MAG: hypothetical protein HGB32_12590 [Geobacteraceae bacterium]|nr:hypothetical protein [Geobacteraceae bacterium]NTW80965.1 hypothetical protein [Geobacteraceae bacterium]